jgi:hypothetical protein
MSVTGPFVFSRPHDVVQVRIVNGYERDYFPSDWTNEEIEDWIFRDRERKSCRILRREIKVRRRTPYKNRKEI